MINNITIRNFACQINSKYSVNALNANNRKTLTNYLQILGENEGYSTKREVWEVLNVEKLEAQLDEPAVAPRVHWSLVLGHLVIRRQSLYALIAKNSKTLTNPLRFLGEIAGLFNKTTNF